VDIKCLYEPPPPSFRDTIWSRIIPCYITCAGIADCYLDINPANC